MHLLFAGMPGALITQISTLELTATYMLDGVCLPIC